MLKKIIQTLIECAAGFFCLLALYLVYKEVKAVGFDAIRKSLFQTPIWFLSGAGIFVLCDYVALSGYDFLALKYIRKKLPFLKILKTAMISFSVTNTTGHAYIAGGSIRYLFYSKLGLNELDILKMIAFESLTFLIGMVAVFDISLLFVHFLNIPILGQKSVPFGIGAVVLTLILFFYILFVVRPRRKIQYKRIFIPAPSIKMTLKQLILGGCDILSSSAVFYLLLRAHIDVRFFHVVPIYLLAQIIGISTQVPGGLGVFEGTFLYLFPHTMSEKSGILAALISFRLLYYFVPLIISGLFLAIEQLFVKSSD